MKQGTHLRLMFLLVFSAATASAQQQVPRFQTTVDVTSRVRAAVSRSKVREGICVVNVAHTTAAVFVNENADPDVQRDLLSALSRLVPDGGDYRHAEGNYSGSQGNPLSKPEFPI